MKTSKSHTSPNWTRRDFIATTAAAGTTFLAAPSTFGQVETDPGQPRRRYALVGVGSRSRMYRQAVLDTYKAYGEMVGYCDNNLGRLQLAQRVDRDRNDVEVPLFDAKDFERMDYDQP